MERRGGERNPFQLCSNRADLLRAGQSVCPFGPNSSGRSTASKSGGDDEAERILTALLFLMDSAIQKHFE
ncbi:hypothetical protein Droror1_Dr00023246 [Drosera rotundifolia]